MKDFNNPSPSQKMTTQEKKTIMELQLDNVVKILNGKLTHQSIFTSTGEKAYRYNIDYKQTIEEQNADNDDT